MSVDPLGETLASDRESLARSSEVLSSIDRFEIELELGVGGMGRVYRAHDPRLKRTVALKLVEGNEGLVREAQAMAQVSHANVVTVYDAGVVDGLVWIAMEYVEGGTWRARIASSPTWRDAVVQLLDAGRGLAAAHAAGIVHRDFKPENILIGRDGKTRVSDFGLAHAAVTTSAGELVTTVAGTPAYMSPEQHRGRQGDERSDQFSFCVTLWESVHGDRPFANEPDPRVLAARAISGNLEKGPRRIPRWLDRTIRRGLSVDPEKRWPSMNALLVALERGLRRRVTLGVGLALVGIGVAATLRFSGHGVTSPPPWRPVLHTRSSDAFPVQYHAISRDREWVAFASDDKLWVQHEASRERTAVELPRGVSVVSLAFGRETGRLFVFTNREDRFELWAISGASWETRKRLLARGVPLDGALSNREDQVALFSQDGELELVSLVDGSSRSIAQRVTQVAFSPDDSRIAITRVNNYVAILDGTSGELLERGDVIGVRSAMWMDRDTLVVSRNSQEVSGSLALVSSSNLRELETRLEFPDFTTLVSFDTNGREILASTINGTTQLGLLDPARGSEITSIDIAVTAYVPVAGWTADGALIFTTLERTGPRIVAVRGGTSRVVVDGEATVLLADALWYRTWVGGQCELWRGRIKGFAIEEPRRFGTCETPVCSRDGSVCVTRPLKTSTSDQAFAVRRWSSETGKTGDVVATVTWSSRLPEAALSSTGRYLAVSGAPVITIHDLQQNTSKVIGDIGDTNSAYQGLSYGADDALYATQVSTAGYNLVRFVDGERTVIATSQTKYFQSVKAAADGTLAVTWRDIAFSFWAIDARR